MTDSPLDRGTALIFQGWHHEVVIDLRGEAAYVDFDQAPAVVDWATIENVLTAYGFEVMAPEECEPELVEGDRLRAWCALLPEDEPEPEPATDDNPCAEHGSQGGCFRCCGTCDADMHRCPGCGDTLEHGVGACAPCVKLHADEPTPVVSELEAAAIDIATSSPFIKPSDVIPERKAGGDNEVPRDGNDRPLVQLPCPNEACVEGRVPSEKKPPPATVQCPKCKGKQIVTKSYTRVTTYIDVLDDKSNLMAWKGRMTLVGVALDPSFTNDALTYFETIGNPESTQDEIKAAKNALNKRAESAQDVAGASEKAEKGTELHGLSELVDQGIDLPDHSSFGDIIDMDAYRSGTWPFLKIRDMERLIVVDEIQCAGTPDRISEVRPGVELIAPDGYVFEPGEFLITDLKTGTIDYGALKMAMQLSIYSRGKHYDWKTGERTSLGNINQSWGLIMHLPAGEGELQLYWADLTLGWEAVQVAGLVRDLRRRGKKALTPASASVQVVDQREENA